MRWRMLLAPAAAVALFAAGCATTPDPTTSSTPTPTTNGLEALDADEILQRATDALDEAESFRMSGAGEAEGQSIEIDALVAGELMHGTFALAGVEFELIVVEDGIYMMAGEETWRMFVPLPAEQLDAILPLLAGKYVKVPPSMGMDAGTFTEPDGLLEPDGEFTKGNVKDYKGQPAITLEDAEGGNTLYVSLVGEPYPLAAESEEGTLEFSEFNGEATIEAPDPADVVDLEQIMG